MTLPRAIHDDEVAAYRSDGAAVIRGVVPEPWIERMRRAVDRVLAEPGPASVEYTPTGASGRYYGDFFVWLRDPDFRAFATESPLPALAARLMSASTVHLFYDQLLVKEPGTREETPWHHDLPYWPLRGDAIVSIWVPFDPASLETGAVRYIRGSHRWGRMFAPRAFGGQSGYADVYAQAGLEPLPDLEAEIDRHEVLAWTLEPGDVLVHHPLTLHHAPGNASATTRRRGLALRYVGEGTVYDARPGTFLDNPRLRATLPEIDARDGEPLHGPLFPRVWPRECNVS
ncbi:MAG: phytanoyl-CoA dioxygenase family protein [Myxococcota bacterium]